MTPNEIRTMVASKDYTAIARVFAAQVEELKDQPGAAAELAVVKTLATRLALVLKADNARLDTAAFIRSCRLDRLPG